MSALSSRAAPLLILALFLAAWLPRVIGLDQFVTPDERKWLARSGNFYYAITHGDLAQTFQREHPGVTIMWAGTLGFVQRFPAYAQQAPGPFTWERENIEAWLLAETPHTPLEMLAAGRWWVVLGITLSLALSFFPLKRLLGTGAAFLSLVAVALDPFHIALSRQLHPDGLSASLVFLALVSFLAWLYAGRARRDLLLSGLVMGLAWLTKSPTILLVPIAGLLLALELWRARQQGADFATLRRQALPFIAWGLLALLLFVGTWPAMWVNPAGTLQQMAQETSDYVERHVNANYFMGEPTEDPGLLFYPVAYLFRTTPFTLIGLGAALFLALRRRSLWDQPRVRDAALGLLAFALLFSLIITVGAKKFDRYLLPAFPPLTILATLGWLGLVEVVRRKPFALTPNPYSLAPLLFLLHALPGLLTAPYYLTYYNPLLGGSVTAPRVLFVGWGEGLDQAAAWLNEQPGAEQLQVASWYADGPFSYFFRGQSEILTDFSPLSWLDTDFTVLYVNQWQRQGPSPEALAWFATREPAHIVRADGLELARVYDMRDAPLPDFIEWNDERRADFGGKIRLVGYRLDKTEAAPGERVSVTLYQRSLAPMETDYNVLVRLVAPDGRELWRDEGWPWGAPTTNWPVRSHRPDGHEIVIPPDAPPGLYALVLSFYDPATFAALPVTAVESGEPLGEARVVDLLHVGPTPAAQRPLEPAPDFGTVARLRGVTLPDRAAPGEALPLALEWESLAHTPESYTLFVHLIAPDGTLVAQQDRPPLDGFAPTTLWDPGERLLDEMTLTLPPDLAPGRYELRVGLYTPTNGRLPVTKAGQPVGDYVTLGSLTIE